jgi:hypothetical protein
MGQVSGRCAAGEPLPAVGRRAGSPRLRGQFRQRCGLVIGFSGSEYYLFSWTYSGLAPALMAPRSVPEAARPGPLRCAVGVKSTHRRQALAPGPSRSQAGEWIAGSHPRTTRGRASAGEFRTGKVAHTRQRGRRRLETQVRRNPRLHLLGGARHPDGAAEYQKPAVNRSFKGSRWPVHSTHGAGNAGRATQDCRQTARRRPGRQRPQHCERDD